MPRRKKNKNKMPFVELSSSETDDEVLFVPYVKPPPPVVDLLESSSDDDTTAASATKNDADEDSKKKKKKKRRKDLSNEQNELNGLTTENGDEINDNSHRNIASSGSDVVSHKSKTNVEQIIESVAVGHPNGVVINGIDRGEQDGNTNVEPSEEIAPGSSSNATVLSTLSILPDDNIITSEEPIPSIRIASSIFESNSCAPIADQLGRDQFIAGVGDTSTPTSKGIQNGPKSRKSPGREKSTIAAGSIIKTPQSKSKATPSPKPRTRRQTPSQRTNIEIVNFLTTLGIELEPQDIPGPKRVRKPRKKSDNLNETAQETPSLPDGSVPEFSSLLPSVVTSVSLPLESNAGLSSANASIAAPIANLIGSSDIGAADTLTIQTQPLPSSLSSSFVSVTEGPETPRSSKKSPKKQPGKKLSDELKTALTMEDVENATFTDQELQNVNLDLRTNLVFDSGNQRERIRLNEKVEPISLAEAMERYYAIRKEKRLRQTEIRERAKLKMMETDTSQDPQDDATSIQEKAKGPGKVVDTNNDLKENQLSVNEGARNIFEISTNKDESQRCADRPSQVKEKESRIFDKGETTEKHKNNNSFGDPKNLFFSFGQQMDTVQNESSPSDSTNGALAETNSNNMNVPYLPVTWTKEMREFYDTIRGENLRVSDVLSTIPDDRRLWTLPFVPPKPKVKSKRIRCDNCKQWGHFSRQCTEKRKQPICRYCGQTGHIGDVGGRGRTCPRPICLNCGKRSRSYSSGCGSCRFGRKPPRCKLCLIEGHEESCCPDNWRRFHSIIAMDQFISEDGEEPHFVSEPAKYRPNRELYCANCSSKGHGVYDCRVSNRMSQYPCHKHRIIKEFASPPKQNNAKIITQPIGKGMSTVTHSEEHGEIQEITTVTQPTEPMDQGTSERTVVSTVVDVEDDNGEEISVESFKVNLKNDTPKKNSGKPWKCSDFPNCRNKPGVGNTCQLMLLTPFDHEILYKVKNGSKIRDIKGIRDVQITVLKDEPQIHICGDMHSGARQDILRLLNKLKRAELRQNEIQNAPKVLNNSSTNKGASGESRIANGDVSGDKKKVVESRGKSGSLKDKDEQTVRRELSSLLGETFESDSAPVASSSATSRPKSPEVIIIDDDDDEDIPAEPPQVAKDPKPAQEEEIQKVGLLPSEWDLLFPESVKEHGIITRLSQIFQVNIFVSKEDLAVYIQEGTLSHRSLAYKNIVNWLEAQAGKMAFKITFTLERNEGGDESQGVVLSRKRSRFEPKPNFKSPKRPRVDDRSQDDSVRQNDSREANRSPSSDRNRQRSGSNDNNRERSWKSRGGKNKRKSGSGPGPHDRGRGFIHQNQNRNQFNNMSNPRYFNNEGPNFNNYMQNLQIPPPPPDSWFSWSDNNGGGGGYNRDEFSNNNNYQQNRQGGQGQNRGRLRYYNMST